MANQHFKEPAHQDWYSSASSDPDTNSLFSRPQFTMHETPITFLRLVWKTKSRLHTCSTKSLSNGTALANIADWKKTIYSSRRLSNRSTGKPLNDLRGQSVKLHSQYGEEGQLANEDAFPTRVTLFRL